MITPERWMRHQATITPWKGQSVTGPEYEKPFACKCLLSLGRKLTWQQGTVNAQETIAKGKVYFPAATVIHPNDRVEISGERYIALTVQSRYNPDGSINHIEVILQ